MRRFLLKALTDNVNTLWKSTLHCTQCSLSGWLQWPKFSQAKQWKILARAVREISFDFRDKIGHESFHSILAFFPILNTLLTPRWEKLSESIESCIHGWSAELLLGKHSTFIVKFHYPRQTEHPTARFWLAPESCSYWSMIIMHAQSATIIVICYRKTTVENWNWILVTPRSQKMVLSPFPLTF